MEDSSFRQIEITGGHLDGTGNERRLIIVVHRPSDNFPGRAIDDRREKDPALPRIDIGYISDHFLARSGGGEIAVHQVGNRPGAAVLLGQRMPPGLRLARLQPQLAHDLADGLIVDGLAAADQGSVDPPVSVFAIVRLEQCLYLDFKQLVPPGRIAFRPVPPFVIPGF
jgi:hypothetical protein